MHKFVLIWLLVLSANLCSCNENREQPEVILKLGHQANEQDVWHLSAMHFAKVVDSLSGGEIEIRIFPSEQLGRELDMIRSIEAGIDDMTITGESMQNWADITGFCGMPYLIRDLDHLNETVNGPVGERIDSEMIEKIGLRPLAYFARGPRHLTSNRPIKSPDDLKGIILRVPTVPISVKTWEGLGAKPTPMTFSEVFTALQQGTVEAQENPFALIYSAGLFEVQKYLNLTGHVIGWVYVVIGEKQFQALNSEHQEVLLLAGEAMQEFHATLFSDLEEKLKQQLQDRGMELVEVDKEAFQKKAREAVINNLSESLQPLYMEITHLPQEPK